MAYTHYIGPFETKVLGAPNLFVSFLSPLGLHLCQPVSHEHMFNMCSWPRWYASGPERIAQPMNSRKRNLEPSSNRTEKNGDVHIINGNVC